MSNHTFNVHIIDGVGALIVIKSKSNLIEPFEAEGNCPSKHCEECFSSFDQDAKSAKDQVVSKIRKHWIKTHKENNSNRKKLKKGFFKF
jgi:hypothetical protein